MQDKNHTEWLELGNLVCSTMKHFPPNLGRIKADNFCPSCLSADPKQHIFSHTTCTVNKPVIIIQCSQAYFTTPQLPQVSVNAYRAGVLHGWHSRPCQACCQGQCGPHLQAAQCRPTCRPLSCHPWALWPECAHVSGRNTANIKTCVRPYHSQYQDTWQAVTQPILRHMWQAVTQPILRHMWQAVTQPISRHMCEAITQPISRHMCEAVTQPLSRQMCEAITQPISRHMCQAIAQPISRHTCEAVTQPISRHMCEAITQPLSRHRTSITAHQTQPHRTSIIVISAGAEHARGLSTDEEVRFGS